MALWPRLRERRLRKGEVLFSEGDACRVELATVQWFEGEIVAGARV